MDESQLTALLLDAKSRVRGIRCSGIARARDVPPGGYEFESAWTVRQASDGRYRVERDKGRIFFDGRACWVVGSDSTRVFKNPVPLPSPLDDAVSPEWLRRPGLVLTDLGASEADGRSCRSVDARTSDGELRHTLTVDQETGLILWRRDELTGHEFELHDVAFGEDFDDGEFRPDLGPAVVVQKPPTRLELLSLVAKAAGRGLRRRM